MKNISIHTDCKIEEEDMLDVFYNLEIYNENLYKLMSPSEKYSYEGDKLIIDWDISLNDDEYNFYKDIIDKMIKDENILYYHTLHSDVHTAMTIK